MSTTTAPAGTPARPTPRSPTLAALVRLETTRLARHPLFVLGALLFVVLEATSPFGQYADESYDLSDGTQTMLDWPVLPAFTLGLAGLIAMNRLTTSAARTGDVLQAVPVDERRRTTALCLAATLPAALALLGASVELSLWRLNPPVNSISWGEFTGAELVAIVLAGVLAALGGPLVGVLVARWWRWPLAAAVVSVSLVLWSLLSINVLDDDSRWQTASHMASPFTLVAANFADRSWHFGGGYGWRVVYLAGLCLLAALGAIGHGTEGAGRRRLLRWILGVAVLTLAALVLSAATGPEGYWGRWDPRWT